MTEQLKYISSELNKELGTNYDLIKFDALSEVQHLQVLLDLLAHYDAGQKVAVKEEEPETISIKLLDMLRNVKYKPEPGTDLTLFRKNLVTGERATIFNLLQWLLKNREQVKKTAYLAKYLIRPDIPADILGIADMGDLLETHDKLMDEFKEAHKHSVAFGKSNSTEVINDIKEMALERDIVIKRLEVAQTNLYDVSNKENLLTVAKALRNQQEKSKQLSSQVSEQELKLKKASEHLQRSLASFRGQAPTPKAPADLMQRLHEELKVNEYLVKEKNPFDLANAKRDVNVLHSVQGHDHITRDNLLQIQEKMETVNREIENMVQKKMAASDPQDDKLTPFRHQASVIKRNKQAVAEKLENLKGVFRETELKLSEKQAQVQQLLGDTVLRGEELKKYVNKLRTKSSVYKRQRGMLSSLKAEAGVLTRTLEILQSRDATLEVALLNHKKLSLNLDSHPFNNENNSIDNLAKRPVNEISQIVSELNQNLIEVKQEFSPLTNRLKPLKEEFQQLQQQYEQKKRVFDSTSINLASQMEPLEREVKELNETINSQEEEWKTLRQRIEKAEQLLDIIDQESKSRSDDSVSPKPPSRMETLQQQIHQQEKQSAILKEEQKLISERQSMLGEQSTIWSQLFELLECKVQCLEESAKKQGSVTITKQAQTLTL